MQEGLFFDSVIQQWQTASSYVFVDIWAMQKNYDDAANFNDKEQMVLMEKAKALGKKWQGAGYVSEISLCRNFTIECVHNYPDSYFDFIYVDARFLIGISSMCM